MWIYILHISLAVSLVNELVNEMNHYNIKIHHLPKYFCDGLILWEYIKYY